MSMSVFIDGVLIEDPLYIQKDSISIDKRVEERSTANFIILDMAGTETYTRGMPVMITRPWAFPPFFVIEFSGFIDTVSKDRLSPASGLLHEISCMDNHYLADKRLVIKAYTTPGQTLADIVNDIWTDYLDDEGITIGEVQTGPIIDTAVFNYVRVSDAFDALKELSGFTWFIDELKQLFFIERITYTTEWDIDMTTHSPIHGSARLVSGNPMYRNTQYKRGGKGTTALQTEHFTGDGILKSFTLGYPLALEPDVWVDAVIQSVGIKGVDSAMDCYWNKSDATFTFDIAPPLADDIEVQYYGQYPLIVRVIDAGAILDRQAVEGSSGIVEDIAYEAQHESQAAMMESTQATLKTYCQESDKYIYQTYETGLQVGQLQKITDARYGLTAEEMLIESITIIPSGETIYYDVSCVSGALLGSWAKFYTRLLIRQDKTIQLGDAQLLVLFQQSETLLLVESTDLHSDAFPPSVYRWIALPPTQGAGHHVAHEALALAESTAIDSHATGDYHWDDADAFWDFATWG